MLTLLLWWVLLACVIFIIGCSMRALKFSRMPVHLRWDLYPVAHEPRDKREHGGSHLEEKDWWEKPHHKSHLGEAMAMGEEIFFLKGVWVNNRAVWWGSMPFHWGLYVMILTTFGLAVAALGFAPQRLTGLLTVLGAAGGMLTAFGALFLLVLRSTDRKFRGYTSPVDRLNLLLLTALGALSAAVALTPPGMSGVAAAMARMGRLQAPEVSTLLAVQMAVAALFLLYMPFTRMVHFFSKYFTYHRVRWDDEPVKPGSPMEARLKEALNFGVDWSAEHVKTGKTWAEVATTIPKPDGE